MKPASGFDGNCNLTRADERRGVRELLGALSPRQDEIDDMRSARPPMNSLASALSSLAPPSRSACTPPRFRARRPASSIRPTRRPSSCGTSTALARTIRAILRSRASTAGEEIRCVDGLPCPCCVGRPRACPATRVWRRSSAVGHAVRRRRRRDGGLRGRRCRAATFARRRRRPGRRWGG